MIELKIGDESSELFVYMSLFKRIIDFVSSDVLTYLISYKLSDVFP